MGGAGVLLGGLVAYLPRQPAFGAGLSLAFLVGACAAIPGLRAGNRALAATEWVEGETNPTELATGRRARSSAKWARALGVLAGLAGLLWTPILAWIFVGVMGGAPGRPFRRKGRVALPEVKRDRSWCERLPEVPSLGERERGRRRERWLEDARSEHASVASFCAVALDLLALGAPPSLVEDALRAALDEVDHARIAFELASAFAGEPLSAGELAAASEGNASSRLRLAGSSLFDGWLNEGAAADRARRSARAADNAAERGALERIAADEARHAVLGQRLAAWAMGAGSGSGSDR